MGWKQVHRNDLARKSDHSDTWHTHFQFLLLENKYFPSHSFSQAGGAALITELGDTTEPRFSRKSLGIVVGLRRTLFGTYSTVQIKTIQYPPLF